MQFGVEDRKAQPIAGEPVAVAARDSSDQPVDAQPGQVVAGLVQGVGGAVEQAGHQGDDRVADHDAALRLAFDLLAEAGIELETSGLVAVGHRVVHGGNDFYRPTVVDDALIAKLKELSPLAPLHNQPNVLGLEVARKLLPDTPHVAVFDTAFFHDLPAAAATYAIDRKLAEKWQIRRYGFHGTSHQYVSEQAAAFLAGRWTA